MFSLAAPRCSEFDLRCAWEQLRAERGWKGAFEADMADPLRSRLVHLRAEQRRRQADAKQLPPAPPRVRVPALLREPARFDVKRAAAGEREED